LETILDDLVLKLVRAPPVKEKNVMDAACNDDDTEQEKCPLVDRGPASARIFFPRYDAQHPNRLFNNSIYKTMDELLSVKLQIFRASESALQESALQITNVRFSNGHYV